jgi:hypothetical protein
MMAETAHPIVGARASDTEAVQLVHHPEITWNEAWNGTRQAGYLDTSDGLPNIRPAPAASALLATPAEMNMTWRRAT